MQVEWIIYFVWQNNFVQKWIPCNEASNGFNFTPNRQVIISSEFFGNLFDLHTLRNFNATSGEFKFNLNRCFYANLPAIKQMNVTMVYRVAFRAEFNMLTFYRKFSKRPLSYTHPKVKITHKGHENSILPEENRYQTMSIERAVWTYIIKNIAKQASISDKFGNEKWKSWKYASFIASSQSNCHFFFFQLV